MRPGERLLMLNSRNTCLLMMPEVSRVYLPLRCCYEIRTGITVRLKDPENGLFLMLWPMKWLRGYSPRGSREINTPSPSWVK